MIFCTSHQRIVQNRFENVSPYGHGYRTLHVLIRVSDMKLWTAHHGLHVSSRILFLFSNPNIKHAARIALRPMV